MANSGRALLRPADSGYFEVAQYLDFLVTMGESRGAVILERSHWYDGWLYAQFIDRMLTRTRREMSKFIERDSTVIDIGCGTGAFAFQLSDKCQRVVGIEVSAKMIQFAAQRKARGEYSKIEFLHANAIDVSKHFGQEFNYATLLFVLHEMPSEIRLSALEEARRVARRLIITEYTVPHPRNLWGMLGRAVEFLAGGEHYQGFRSFLAEGGVGPLLAQAGLQVEQERTLYSGTQIIIGVS